MNDGAHARADAYELCRAELTAYAARMTANRAVAEELAQEAAVRLLETQQSFSDDPRQMRAWLFRVVTNLALDHLRRHSTWRELPLLSTRERASSDQQFIDASVQLRASPEVAAIAREHLVVCFSCTLRNLEPQEAASLLLKEVYGFTVDEVADAVGASFGQVKNWIQSARSRLQKHYESTCALVSQSGVCYQCVELDQFFNGQARNPLAGTRADMQARLQVVRAQAAKLPGIWHERMFELMDDVLS